MCKGVCNDCIYYFEDTDFCLNRMYNLMKIVTECETKKTWDEYPATTLISNEELEFSEELYDWRDDDITIGELFNELKAVTEEELDY